MANFCPQCGAPLTPTSKFCPQCGAKIAAAVLQEAALNADARQEAATAHTAEEQAPVQQPVTETSKEESVSPHFTTPQSPQKPKNAEDYLQMLRADLTIEAASTASAIGSVRGCALCSTSWRPSSWRFPQSFPSFWSHPDHRCFDLPNHVHCAPCP